ncbi:hypothetical protein [Paraburkholderia sp. BCC1886]|uniref:hypothetical protein n=1 Tax=Paraburkholderia sp. BCC1886 TaxID=2562670 RepID=UPI00118254C4|nr:hypothetical protein [Paraburkholderia sp. BCC1886]
MNRGLWELRRLRWRLGNFGLLAALMIVVAATIALLEIRPMQRDLETRRESLAVREARLVQPPPPVPDDIVANGNPDQRFGIFLHSFHAMAAKSGLSIPQVVYQSPQQDDPAVRRYLVESTFSSDYLRLRAFIATLRHLDGVRIERLSITRPNIGATQLEVRIQCSYLVEVAP